MLILLCKAELFNLDIPHADSICTQIMQLLKEYFDVLRNEMKVCLSAALSALRFDICV